MLKTEQEYSAEFEKFVTEFNKVYNSDDDRKAHFKTFCDNLDEIEKHNATPGITYTMGVNQFADLTVEEMKKCGYIGGLLPK